MAKVKDLKYEDIIDYVEVVRGDNCIPYHNVNEARKALENSCGSKKIYIYERGSQYNIISRVHDSYMWGSPITADILDKRGLIQRKCSGYCEKYKDILIYPENHRFTELDKKFIDKLYISRNHVAFRDYQ